RRLLYVGMTRAEDRLIVCGYRGTRPAPSTWIEMARGAFAGVAGVEELNDPEDCAPVLRFRVTPPEYASTVESAEPERETPPLPPELTEPLPQPPVLPRPLQPSGASALIEDEYEAVSSPRSPVLEISAPSLALERGNAIHRLLQLLPELPPEEREGAARR